MSRNHPSLLLAPLFALALPGAALAQRATFERTFDVSNGAVDVSTTQGAVDVRAGTGSRIVVKGSVAVRLGWDVPANAAALVRAVADHPPVAQDGQTVRVQPPTDADERRAVTISYVIEVPAPTSVRLATQSGAASVSGVAGSVNLTTQSGATHISDVTGAVHVTTQSAALTLRTIGGATTALSQSGAVTVDGTRGSLSVKTQSSAGSGSVTLRGASVQAGGVVEKKSIRGDVGSDGPVIRANSRSGSVMIAVAKPQD